MKLTEKELESVKCTLIDETSDFILARVCDVMVEKLADEGKLSADISGHNLDIEQIKECSEYRYKHKWEGKMITITRDEYNKLKYNMPLATMQDDVEPLPHHIQVIINGTRYNLS